MRLLLLTRYSHLGASSRVRFCQYLPYLQERGVQVTVAPLFGDWYLADRYDAKSSPISILRSYLERLGRLLQGRKFDGAWIEGEVLPWLPAWGESLLARLRVPYAVDYDDAIFHRYDLNPRRAVRFLLGGKLSAIVQRASLVTVGNEYLADQARAAGAAHVEQVPTAVDLDRYDLGTHGGNTTFTIGWIGSPATDRYLQSVAPALAQVCAGGAGRLLLVGSRLRRLANLPTEAVEWSEATEVALIRQFDVGIMPLDHGRWELGKCGYKLIQYMACEKPVVASPVGANPQIVEPGVHGYLATTTSEWVDALATLRCDAGLRSSQGKAGRLKVEREYCTRITGPRIASLICSAMGKSS